MASIRLVLTDNHEMILESLALLLSKIDGLELLGSFTNNQQVIDFLHQHKVDILITNMNVQQHSGIDLTLQVRQLFPDIPVLMLTDTEDVAYIREAFRAGISGYVLKKANKTELERAIRTIARGEKYFSELVILQLVGVENSLDHTIDTTLLPLPPLTDREIEIIKLIAQELSTNAIADKLFISPGTVETHRHNIIRKLGVKNSIGIIKYAVKHKLI